MFIAVSVMLYQQPGTKSSTLSGSQYIALPRSDDEGTTPVSDNRGWQALDELLPLVFLFKQHSNRDSAQATFHSVLGLSIAQALAPVFCLLPSLFSHVWHPDRHASNSSTYFSTCLLYTSDAADE